MKTIICEKEEMYDRAAALVCRFMRDAEQNGDEPVLALACGETMKPLWERLVTLAESGQLSFSAARVLCVTEFSDVKGDHSCQCALENGLLNHVDVKPENCFFPDSADPGKYDALIDAMGGVDLAVLGIGEDCHIGYNEPGTLYDTHTHVQKLTDRTKRQLLKRGFSEAELPGEAVTMGIKDLADAREILVLASGRLKAAAVYQMLYAKTTSYIPAAYLQIPPEVTILLDHEAAAEL